MGYSAMIAQGLALSKKEKTKKDTSSDDMVSSLLDDLEDNPYARHYQRNENMESIATPIPSLQEAASKTLANSVEQSNHAKMGDLNEHTWTHVNSSNEHTWTHVNSSNEQFNRADVDSSTEHIKRADVNSSTEHTWTDQPSTREQTKKNKTVKVSPRQKSEQEPLVNKMSNVGIRLKSTAQYTLANYLKKLGSHITSHAIICNETGLALGTSRRQLKNFQDWGMISIEKYYGARNMQGMRITVITIPDLPEKAYLIHKKTPTLQEENTEKVSTREQSDRTHVNSLTEHTWTHVNSPTGQFKFPLLDRKKESIFLSKKKENSIEQSSLIYLNKEDISFYWPNLAMIDFGENQIRQIFERLAKLGKDALVCTDSVRQGLTHADAALALGKGKLMDHKGEAVADPRAYIFRSLARDGYYAAPKGYVSPEAQRLRDEAEQARLLSQAQKDLAELQKNAQAQGEESTFSQWRAELTEQKLEEIQAQAPAHAKKGTAFEKWVQLVFYPAQRENERKRGI